MSSDSVSRRTFLVMLIVSTFILADLSLVNVIQNDENSLDDNHSVSYAISVDSASKDAMINSSSSVFNYGTDDTSPLGQSVNGESRLLFAFPMNLTSSHSINSAIVNITCSTNAIGNQDATIYFAELTRSWNDSVVSWINPNAGGVWSSMGADGENDRGDFEPPVRITMNTTVSLNVTKIAQDAARNNQSEFSILVASIGTQYTCAMSENSNSQIRPSLTMDYTNSAMGDGGSFEVDFVDNGEALIDGSFLLNADLTPTPTWLNGTGSNMEVQFSLAENWQGSSDLEWHFISDSSSVFAGTASSGSMTVPSNLAFTNGSEVYYRIRTIDSTNAISDWIEGWFSLPNHDVVLNSDGTATLELDYDDLGLSLELIEDAQVDERNRNGKFGTTSSMQAAVTTSKEALIHMRLNLQQLGLHENSTIIDASINLTRAGASGTPELSIHEMEQSGLWIESEITWNRAQNSLLWIPAGRDYIGAASDSMVGNSNTGDYSFDITDSLQQWIRDGAEGEADYAIVARGEFGSYASSGTDSVTYYSSEETNDARKPKLYINYDWSNVGSTPAPELTSPLDGLAVWNQSGHNFTGNTTPTMSWNGTLSSGYDMVFQLATDETFRERVNTLDTRTDNNFTTSSGMYSLTGGDSLTLGNMYFWRFAHVESDGRMGPWEGSSFFVSSLSSTWLGGDRYEFRLKHGNGSLDGQFPECGDTYIDSGSPNTNYDDESEMQVSWNTWPSETTILAGCNLLSNLLPNGYAVEYATYSMQLAATPYNSPTVGIWESSQHDWDESSATWAKYDGVNSWSTAGAKGTEKMSLLSTAYLGSSSSGDRIEWNVTQAVQNAMRDETRVDFIIGVTNAGSGNSRDALFYSNEDSTSRRAELTFVYVPGSNAVPNQPLPVSPGNGSWSLEPGIDMSPDSTPTLSWNYSGNLTVGGWALQLDTSNSFDSASTQFVSSWTDNGFDVSNNTYTPQTDLANGTSWYWRVRAISSTNQLGQWSNAYSFLLPNLNTYLIDSNTSAVEIRHNEAMPALNLPHLYDTWIAEGGTDATLNYTSSSSLKVGEVSSSGSSYQASTLIKIPLTEIPTPSNARITGAELNMYSQFTSDTGVNIAVRPVLQNWNLAVNGTSYDGVNNWSNAGARAITSDVGYLSDIEPSPAADWMTWDVTELAQFAVANGQSYLSLALMASDDESGTVTFTSVDGAVADRPWLNLTWSAGTGSFPSNSGANQLPPNRNVVWDHSTHSPQPEVNPTMTWNHPNANSVDDWRIYIQNDADDIMQGFSMFDSRTNTSLFDIANLSFTLDSSLQPDSAVRWFVQPVNQGMLGPKSASTVFFVPRVIGDTLDSTSAYINLTEGSAVPEIDYPSGLFSDTFVDSGNSNGKFSTSTSMWLGRSAYTSSQSSRSSIVTTIDMSSIPLQGSYEFKSVIYSMRMTSSSSGNILASVSTLNTPYDHNISWASPTNGTSWVVPGAYHSADSEFPYSVQEIYSTDGYVNFDITHAVQNHYSSGATAPLAIIIQAEENLSVVNGRMNFYSSDYNDWEYRPSLNVTYEMTNAWIDSAPTNLTPVDGSTMWNLSAPRPSGAESVTASWTPSSANNETGFYACFAKDVRMTTDLECVDTNDAASLLDVNAVWDSMNYSLTGTDLEGEDAWVYWSLYSYQEVSTGNNYIRHGDRTDPIKFRVPEDQGSDDGNGNHTVTLSAGSIFEETSPLPAAPDVHVLSSSTNTNFGGSTIMPLGSSSGGESEIYLEFDLSQAPWPSAMTPTSMVLKMYRASVAGTASTTISAHACSSFSESSATWSNSPVCSPSEITRSTLPIIPSNGWFEWDLTALAQSNIANGNFSMTILLQSVGTPSTQHNFYSGEYNTDTTKRPQLVLDYIDNTDGILPPAQPVLTYPNDGDVLYQTGQRLLSPEQNPTLTWSPVSNATGYVVTISNESGQYKFRSWETSSINGTTFRFNQSLNAGDTYEWWVQAVNQSVPGPSSSRYSFAIGDPLNFDNQDNTWTYEFQTGNEILDFGHTNVRDGYIQNVSVNQNFGSQDFGYIGTNCQNALMECRAFFGLDLNQVPLPANMAVHSANLEIYVDQWSTSGGANSVTLSVYRLSNNAWSELGSTWNRSDAGTNWGAPGLLAGTDYDAVPVSSTTISTSTTGWIDIPIGHGLMTMTGDYEWFVVATPNVGEASMRFITSDNIDQGDRPIISLNYTQVVNVSISPGTQNTDADTPVQFGSTLYDFATLPINAPVTWSASNGSVSSNGLFTPYSVGTHTVSVCWGVQCATANVVVSPGAPTTLFAYTNPDISQMTADESLEVVTGVRDQNGNLVNGITPVITVTNGTVSGTTYNPYTAGLQTITVTWGQQQIELDVTVTYGAPVYFELSGCSGVVAAGTTCAISYELFDQYGNLMPNTEAGTLTWSVTDGNFSETEEEFTADHVGSWVLSLSSSSGAADTLDIEVGHGQMADLEITTSATSITADEVVYLNTTRIDVRGNRLPVSLPAQNWTSIADGTIQEGSPAIWAPTLRGNKVLEARYETILQTVEIQVSQGEMIGLVMVVNSEDVNSELFEITADDQIFARVKAVDQMGNRWSVTANWSAEHPEWQDQIILSQTQAEETIFRPILASVDDYRLSATYEEFSAFIDINVDHGMMVDIMLSTIASHDSTQTGQSFDMTADDSLTFTVNAVDDDDNQIDTSLLTWSVSTEGGEFENQTVNFQTLGLVWEAGLVGNYTIKTHYTRSDGITISEQVSATVNHGVAVEIYAESPSYDLSAGDTYDITVRGNDSDGNNFLQNVEWADGQSSATDINETGEGTYIYEARRAGVHTLTYSTALTSGEWSVEVQAIPTVSHFIVDLSSDKVEQLERIEIEVRSFDEYWNEIPTPGQTKVETTDAHEKVAILAQGNGVWYLDTVSDGEHILTVSHNRVTQSVEYTVESSIAGFYAANAPLSYIGSALGGIVLIVLAFFGITILRGSGGSEYDDYDDYDEDDDYEDTKETPQRFASGPSAGPSAGPSSGPSVGPSSGPSAGPSSGPSAGPSASPSAGPSAAPEPVEETPVETTETSDDGIVVDDDGVEWYEDGEGVNWYRMPGESDWQEWQG